MASSRAFKLGLGLMLVHELGTLDEVMEFMDGVADGNAVEGIRNPLAVSQTMIQTFLEYLGRPSAGFEEDLLYGSIFTDVASHMSGQLRNRLGLS